MVHEQLLTNIIKKNINHYSYLKKTLMSSSKLYEMSQPCWWLTVSKTNDLDQLLSLIISYKIGGVRRNIQQKTDASLALT